MRALPLLALLLLLAASPLLSVMVFSPAPARAGTPPTTSCSSSATLVPSLLGQWNENAPFPSSKCGNALYCAYNAGYDFCVTDSYPESSAVFGQVVAGKIFTWEGTNFSACAYAEPFCRPGTNGEVVDCTSYSGYMYCVDQTGVWTSSPLTTGGFGNWTILGDANNAFDSVAESCGVVGSHMACLTQLGWEYTFPLNSTGGTGMPSECVQSYGGNDWFHNPACDSIWVQGNGGGSSACVGLSAGLECQAGIGGSYPDTYWLNDTLLYPVNSTGFMLNATVVGPAFGASIIPHDAELGFYQGSSCVFVSVLYCLGGYGYNSTSGSPYPPFDTFGNLTLSGWDYLSQYPFGVYSPGARVDEICCSWSPSAGANLVTDGSTFVLSVGGVVSADYPYPSTNESYSYIFSVPPVHVYPINNYVEGNWTSYQEVYSESTGHAFGGLVAVDTTGVAYFGNATGTGFSSVFPNGTIESLGFAPDYAFANFQSADSSAYGTYLVLPVASSDTVEVLEHGAVLQTLTLASGHDSLAVAISADGQFIFVVDAATPSDIELFQAVGTPASPAYSASNPLPGPGVCLSNCGAVQTSTTGQQVAYTSAQASLDLPLVRLPAHPHGGQQRQQRHLRRARPHRPGDTGLRLRLFPEEGRRQRQTAPDLKRRGRGGRRRRRRSSSTRCSGGCAVASTRSAGITPCFRLTST